MLSRIPNSTLTYNARPMANTKKQSQSPTFSGGLQSDSFQKVSHSLKFSAKESTALIKKGNLSMHENGEGKMKLWTVPGLPAHLVIKSPYAPEKILYHASPHNLTTVRISFEKDIPDTWADLADKPDDFEEGMEDKEDNNSVNKDGADSYEKARKTYAIRAGWTEEN